jgi:ABC-2 type transport system ATP-binding protein
MMEDLHHLPKAEGRRVADRLLDQFDVVEVPSPPSLSR